MKHLSAISGVTCALLMMLTSAGAAPADETAASLLDKNLAARGGAEKIAAIKSVVFRGETRAPGDFRLTFASAQARTPSGEAMRNELSVQGLTLIQAYDGKTGWRVNPFEGRKTAERVGADEARSLADDASIEGALLASHRKGSTVEYQGREDVDGTQAFKLRVAEKDGDIYTYCLDPDTFLEIKVFTLRKIRGSESETETELGEYEQVAGVWFPFSIVTGPKNASEKQTISIESGEANVSLPQDLFAMPSGATSARLTATKEH